MTLGVVLGLIGALLSFASFMMKDMLRLRLIALWSNVFFLSYGIIEAQLPSILLNCVVLPLNLIRAHEIRQMVRRIENAHADSPLGEWLLPLMKKLDMTAGTPLFNKGDEADKMYYIATGEVMLVEKGKTLGENEMIGELGIFTPHGRRTISAACHTDCVIYVLGKKELHSLYYLNPDLGFHLIRLIVERFVEERKASERVRTQPAAREPSTQPGETPAA